MTTPVPTPSPWRSWLTAVIGLGVGVATVFAVPGHVFFTQPDRHADERGTGERWACPMMDFVGTKPGTCPVCGMTLQRVTAGEVNQEQAKRMGVQLATIAEGPALVTVHAAGTAGYDHRFTRAVIARVSGRIVRRHKATSGCCQEVAAGEPVVDIYSPEVFQAQVDLAAAQRLGNQELATAIGERFTRWNLGPVAQAIKEGKPPTDTVSITTPFTGQVLLDDMVQADESMMVGKEITADTPLLRLVDADRLILVIHVPEARAWFLREGQSVDLASDDVGPLPGLDAKVGRVSSEINPETRTVEVRVYLSGARSRLRPGSLVKAGIKAVLGPDLKAADPEVPATWGRFSLIPASAVLSTGVRHIAWVMDRVNAEGHQHFTLAPLALGPRLEDADGKDQYVVRAGVKVGDQVAAQGAFLVDSQAQLAGSASLLFPVGAK